MRAKIHRLCASCGNTTTAPSYSIDFHGPDSRRTLAVLCDPCATHAMFPHAELHAAISNTLKGTS